MKQLWIGSTDVYGMLTEVGGWHVGSIIAVSQRGALDYVIGSGWVQERTHYFPPQSEWPPVPAYELTDEGLKVLGSIRGAATAKHAAYVRQLYRDNVAKWS